MALGPDSRIAIVVPTKDPSVDPARRCLALVRETTKHLNVDLQVVTSSGPGFRLPRSINQGIRAAPDADAWVLLNDDAWMDPHWLDAMIDAARSHPEVGIVGAVLRFPDGRIQHAGAHFVLKPGEFLREALARRAPFWALRELRRRGLRGGPYMYAHWHSVDRAHRLDYVTGACALITKDCMDKVGLYNEDYIFGFEDADHALRALAGGFEIALATRATGIHHEGASGQSFSAKQLDSEATFRRNWSAASIAKLTRGRTGVYA